MKSHYAVLLLCFAAPAAVEGVVVQIEHKGAVRAIYWTEDGKTLATGGADGVVRFTDVMSGKETRQFSLGGSVYGIAVSRDGKCLGVRQDSGNSPPASVVDVNSGKVIRSLSQVYGRYYTPHLAFSADGKTLYGAGPRARMTFQFRNRGASASGSSQANAGYFSAIARNGLYYVWGRSTGQHLIYHATGRSVTSIKTGPAQAMAFSPDGAILAIALADKNIALWDIGKRQIVAQLKEMRVPVKLLTFSGDGKLLAAYDEKQRTVWLWDVASRRVRRRVPVRQRSIHTMRLSKDGRMLATAAANRAVVWNVARRTVVKLEPIELSKEELKLLWNDLANQDFAKVDAAFQKLTAGQEMAVPFLKGRVRQIAVPMGYQQRLQQLLDDLNNDSFRRREQAQAELSKLGELAIVPLQRLVESKKTPLEVQIRARRLLESLKQGDITPDRQRVLESLDLLETIATPAARSVLKEIARDALIPSIQREAQAAVERFANQAGQ